MILLFAIMKKIKLSYGPYVLHADQTNNSSNIDEDEKESFFLFDCRMKEDYIPILTKTQRNGMCIK